MVIKAQKLGGDIVTVIRHLCFYIKSYEKADTSGNQYKKLTPH